MCGQSRGLPSHPGQSQAREGNQGIAQLERLRKTAMVRPRAKEGGWEQEGPEEGGTAEMTAGSWEKQGIVKDTGGDRGEAAEMLVVKISAVTRG